MLTAVYPGSFDPVTNGHLDVIIRSSKIVDKLYVSILENPNKKCLFSVEERKAHLRMLTKNLPNVEIDSFCGMTVDYAKQKNAKLIIRGLRVVTDFEYEFQMALINRSMEQNIETLFIATDVNYLFLSSSAVKEVASCGGDLSNMVPKEIISDINEKYKK